MPKMGKWEKGVHLFHSLYISLILLESSTPEVRENTINFETINPKSKYIYWSISRMFIKIFSKSFVAVGDILNWTCDVVTIVFLLKNIFTDLMY